MFKVNNKDTRATSLNRQASQKKYVKGNHSPFLNKTLTKKITKMTEVKSKFLKIGKVED